MDEGKLSNRGPDMAKARQGKVISFTSSTFSTIRDQVLANSAPPLSVTGSAIAPSARMARKAARISVGDYNAMAQVACRRWCLQLGMSVVVKEALAKPKLSWRVAIALE